MAWMPFVPRYTSNSAAVNARCAQCENSSYLIYLALIIDSLLHICFTASTPPTSVGNSKATTTLDGYYRLDIKESNEVLTRVKRKIGLLHDGHNSSHGRKGNAAHLTEGIHGNGGISRDKIEHFANWFEDEHTVDK